MEKVFLNSTIKDYLDKLASNLPAPGGGSAAAVVSSCGVSCLLMVANFTLNKKGYEQHQQEIQKIIEELSIYKTKIEEYIDKDVEAYNEVVNSFKLPKTTPLEQEIREKEIQKASLNAAQVALGTMILSHKCIIFAEQLLKIGNKNLITDIACGAIFLLAAIQAAKYNVIINLKNIKDTKLVIETKKQIKQITTDAKIITKKILQKIQI